MSSDEAVITDREFSERFEAAREACLTGHEAGCTYGGMSPGGGFWLAVEGCPLRHGDACTICGQTQGWVTGFGDWAADETGLLIWGVFLCDACKERELALHPEKWRAPA